eukprot:TRINITY_DN13049_c0_g1_i1.p1 TRINITY_DN13049_c0_g1~~TRINITY_DN13049_c0_g1_i1.p1  ORF type:complete len:340 (+),score=64.76 TRINITY_DN13049_c0_g1_i1:44-1021(+)
MAQTRKIIPFFFALILFVHSTTALPRLFNETLYEQIRNPSSPLKVMYIDYQGINWNAPQQTVQQAVQAGFNVIILSFLLGSGPADMAEAWTQVSQSDQQSTIQQAHQAGAIVMVSAGGSTDSPYSTFSGSQYGTNAATWAQDNNLDGVDFDMENLNQGFTVAGLSAQQTVQWLADCTSAARSVLSNAIISHAPQAPYFGPVGGNLWPGSTGGYTAVYKQAPVDFFNLQFYNQGASCYEDYNGIFTSSCSNFPGTSVQQINSYGIPMNVILIGKPVLVTDASNGYVPPATLGQYLQQASSIGWSSGVMGWVWHDQQTNQNWIDSIY